MKKIVLSLATIVMVGSLAMGATSAWFSSQKTIAGNTMATGTLKVALVGDATATYDLGTMKLEPGGETEPAFIDIVNDGNLNLGWFGYFNFGGNTELKDVIYIKEAQMEFFKPTTGTWEPTDQFIKDGRGFGPAAAYYNTLADQSAYKVITLTNWNLDNAMGVGGGVQEGALKPDYKYRLTFKFGMVPEAGNEFQNKILTNSYTVVATQIQAGALSAVDTADSRISIGSPSDIVIWMNQQIAKQP